jgi:GPN-loop GTPase
LLGVEYLSPVAKALPRLGKYQITNSFKNNDHAIWTGKLGLKSYLRILINIVKLVIGPPGSGKSTYCYGSESHDFVSIFIELNFDVHDMLSASGINKSLIDMTSPVYQFLGAIGRKCSVVNLDPANDRTNYPCALDVRDLVKLDDVMEEEGLGPNGGVIYALEELENNIEWLETGLASLGEDYILFDCPGQVELFTHHTSLRNIFFRIQKMGYRLVSLHLTDSHSLTLPSLYISTLLLSLRSMLQMDLPHLNVLTKIDLLSTYSPLPFNLDFYTEVQDLTYLLPHLEAEQSKSTSKTNKFAALNEAIVELVSDFGLVGFETLAVEDKASMMSLLQTIDRAGGYAFGGAEGANDTVWQVAMREGGGRVMDVKDVQERWIDNKDEWDEKIEEDEREQKEKEMADIEAEEMGAGEDVGMRPPDSGVKIVRKKI